MRSASLPRVGSIYAEKTRKAGSPEFKESVMKKHSGSVQRSVPGR